MRVLRIHMRTARLVGSVDPRLLFLRLNLHIDLTIQRTRYDALDSVAQATDPLCSHPGFRVSLSDLALFSPSPFCSTSLDRGFTRTRIEDLRLDSDWRANAP